MSVTAEDNLQEPYDDEPKEEVRKAPRPAPTPKRSLSVYCLYAEADDGILHPLGEYEGGSPDDAIGNWSDDNPDESLEGVVFVPIAKRNFSRVTAQVQRVTKLVKVEE